MSHFEGDIGRFAIGGFCGGFRCAERLSLARDKAVPCRNSSLKTSVLRSSKAKKDTGYARTSHSGMTAFFIARG
ncbi:MAG: hypothetical protein AAF927_32850 [Bacteroidota bacterium]